MYTSSVKGKNSHIKRTIDTILRDRRETVTHFLFLNHIGGPHYRLMFICKYEMSRMFFLYVIAVLWCGVINVRRRRMKVKPGAGISILLSKVTKEAGRVNVPIRPMNHYRQ